ncbi:hypothetical protein AHF37_01275 [Paragonimus kellicotti]|nr:hypothetical protein AHF37_01275 [Paragonimus kellicotti]
MEVLPLEVLERILYFLPTIDQKSAALPCRRLYSAVFRPLFLVTEAFCISGAELRGRSFSLKIYKIMRNVAVSIGILVSLRKFYLTPCRRYHLGRFIGPGSFRKSLLQIYLQIPTYLTEFLADCVNLQNLDLNGCNCLFASSSKEELSASFLSKAKDRQRLSSTVGRSLRCLSLAHLWTISDADLAHVLSTFPLINDLDISGCFISFGSREILSHTSAHLPVKPRLSFKTVLKELRSLGLLCLYA